MPSRTILVVLVAVMIGAIVSVIVASSLSAGDGSAAGHPMPDGSTMQGDQMP